MKQASTFLIENGLVEPILEGLTQAGGGLRATVLGKAIVSSALSVDEGLFIHRELERSMRSFILHDELVRPPHFFHVDSSISYIIAPPSTPTAKSIGKPCDQNMIPSRTHLNSSPTLSASPPLL